MSDLMVSEECAETLCVDAAIRVLQVGTPESPNASSKAVPQSGLSGAHDEHGGAVRGDVIPAKIRRERSAESSGYVGSRRHRDNAFRKQLEMAIGYVRELLDLNPNDPLDAPVIRERKQETARGILDYVWALMAIKSARDGEAHPLPGLIVFDEEVLRLQRLPRSAS